MDNKLVNLKLHGDLGKTIGENWEFCVNSVQEALYALNMVTDSAFNRYFIGKDRLCAKYRVLINGKDFRSPESEINKENAELLTQTNLIYKVNDLETIDIVPFIENSDSKALGIVTMILGVVLVIIGIAVPGAQALIPIGIALFAAGTVALLSRPPAFQNFRNIDKFGNQSYLFSGPTNIIGEGGPVPVGYGRMLVGSQVISSAYKIQDYQTFRDTKN
jgi:predicted phage tail protein